MLRSVFEVGREAVECYPLPLSPQMVTGGVSNILSERGLTSSHFYHCQGIYVGEASCRTLNSH